MQDAASDIPSGLEARARELLAKVEDLAEKRSSNIPSDRLRKIEEKAYDVRSALHARDSAAVSTAYEQLKRLYEGELKRGSRTRLIHNVQSLLLAIVFALFIRAFIVQPFKIPTGSMVPTLLVGDHLLVNKFIYGVKLPITGQKILPGLRSIERGDVVVFVYPNHEGDPAKENVYYIKRVVAVPGDSIDVRGRELLINGEPVPMSYVGDYAYPPAGSDKRLFDLYLESLDGRTHETIFNKGQEETPRGNVLPVDKVPDGYVFVMGDNRDNSFDSRFWGFVPIDSIAGKAFLIHWSWNTYHRGIVDLVRWGRIGTVIR